PDGRFVVYSVPGSAPTVFAVTRENRANHPLALPPGGDSFGLTREGVWYADDTSLWIAPFDGGAAARVGARAPGASGLVRPAPDGIRLAYGCGQRLCLQDRAGGNLAQLDLTPRDLVWSRDGALFAAADEHGLVIASRAGAIRYRVPFFWST